MEFKEIMKSLAFFLLIVTFILMFIYILSNDYVCLYESELEEIENDLPISIKTQNWFINEDNPKELLFDYYIYNYGKKEIKNLSVKCVLYNSEDEVVTSKIHEVGNVASQSVQFKETRIVQEIDEYGEYWLLCYTLSCDNCDILYKRIPELNEMYSVQ